MDDRIYAGIALAIAGAVAVDLVLTGGASLLFLARKLLDLVGTLTFWRH